VRGPSWTEIAARGRRCLLIVPLGSYEQHGPHLPLDTDTCIAAALAERAVELPFVVVASPLAYGASGEHRGFPGTLSMGTACLAEVVVELVRSARTSCSGVVVVNAHGGNGEALELARRRCQAEGDQVRVWNATIESGDAHAGRTETSLMLAIAPDSVRLGAIHPGRLEPLQQLWPELRSAGVRAVSPNGVLGDPTLASADEGLRILEALSARLIAVLRSWWSEIEFVTSATSAR